jgi:hypothetical protein
MRSIRGEGQTVPNFMRRLRRAPLVEGLSLTALAAASRPSPIRPRVIEERS